MSGTPAAAAGAGRIAQAPGREPSFWLEQLAAAPRRAPLRGVRDADVCIVGAGFTGLWTAYELRRAAPALEVVVLEARHAGFGASGRNGGWVLGKLSGSPQAWERRGGPGAARAMALAIQATVEEVGAVIARERIDCAWRHGGSLTVAQSPPQLERLRAERERELRWGGEEVAWELLDAARVRERVAVAGALGALYTPHCARVQPAALALGLADAAERAGASICERSRALSVTPGAVRTAEGLVRARRVVLATEAYTVDLPARRRALLPLGSAMIVAEPLAASLWAQLGWAGAETLLDGAHLYSYSQRTADGRVAIGGRGVPYRFGSRTEREGPVPARTVAELRARLAALFPPLREAAVQRAWHGVLGVARDWCPTVSFEPASGIAFAGGYAGEGVAASNLAARTLRDLLLGRDSELTRLPWVGEPARRWEPEPLRYLGARGVHRLYRLADRLEARTGRRSSLGALANRLAGR
jgi:glycine/D-amino acid oxidase-like deaminating enzyme